MDDRHLICSLCGFEFEPTDALCDHGCPMRSACDLVKCPSCDYEFPKKLKAVSWLRELLVRRAEPEQAPCEICRPMTDLDGGERARVVSLTDRGRRNSLAVFGLVPGSEVRLLQRRPAFVVQVGETQLAIEAEIAAGIFVERLEPASRSTGESPAAEELET
jgi:Fe2+ transport system protein FeoA